ANHSTSGSDAIYDLHAGFQGQWGNWVLGVEFGYSACFNECRVTSGVLPVPPFPAVAGVGAAAVPANAVSENKITQLATIGPRLGWAWDRFMIYGTGGWASANLKSAYCNTNSGVCGPNNGFAGANLPFTLGGASWNQGWFAGAGFEWMVHRGALVD